MAKRERATWELDTGAADTARLLMLLAQAQQQHLLQQHQQLAHQHGHGVAGVPFPVAVAHHRDAAAHGGRVFECKTCSRQFPTFQALGGHRASHKRPRVVLHQQQEPVVAADHTGLCLGRQPLQLQLPTPTPTQQPAAKPRVHECPVCGLEFAIGQALGGHMRRHRAEAEADAAAEAAAPPQPSSKARQPAAAPDSSKACDVAGGICLDLNLTPSENCAKCRRSVVVLGAAAGQQGGVHKAEALAMLDCSL